MENIDQVKVKNHKLASTMTKKVCMLYLTHIEYENNTSTHRIQIKNNPKFISTHRIYREADDSPY